MSYGSYLTDASGEPFYILDTMPLCLIDKKRVLITGGRGVTVTHPNDGVFRLVFCKADIEGCNFFYYLNPQTGSYTIDSSGEFRGYYLDIYIFGYQYQIPPTYGMAIWDAAGRCVITNETKVLRGVEGVGDPANPNNSGFNVSATLQGDWAVMPAALGVMTGVINQGGQIYPFSAPAYTSAYKSGGNTVIKAEFRGDTGGGGASNIQYSNFRNAVKAINVTRY